MKLIRLILAGLMFCFLFSCCAAKPESPPVLSISCNNGAINYQPPDEEGSTQVGFNRLIQTYGGIEKSPYLPLGEYGGPIVIDFQQAGIPDRYELKETLLSANGSTLPSSPLPGDENQLTESGNTISFLLNPLHETFGSTDPEPGQSYRGFRLACTWGDNTYEYAFILRTDGGLWQSAPSAKCSGEGAEWSAGGLPMEEAYLYRKQPLELSLFTPNSSFSQTIPFHTAIHITFPEDGAPDSVELVNDVMVLNGSNYEYQGDTRALPASAVIPQDDGFSFTVDPESFAQGEESCNVTYALCTWDGLTSVYSIIFRVNL